MGLFSFINKETKLKCDWCGKEMEEAVYVKHTNSKKFIFCSQPCKQTFRKSGKGKIMSRPCPTCALRR